MLQKLKTIGSLVLLICALGVGFWGGGEVEKGKTAEKVAFADAQARAEMEAAALSAATTLDAKKNAYLGVFEALIADPAVAIPEPGRAALLLSVKEALTGDPDAAQAMLPDAALLKPVATPAVCNPGGQLLKLHPAEKYELCDGAFVLSLVSMSDGVAQQVRLTVNGAEAHLEPGQRVGFGNGCFAMLQGIMVEDARQHAAIRIACTQ